MTVAASRAPAVPPPPGAFFRPDLRAALERGGVDTAALGALHRILLTTDGTVTDILQAYYLEPMRVAVLSQGPRVMREDCPVLGLARGHALLHREILLEGAVSGRCVLHASSLIVDDRLSESLRAGLLSRRLPVGHLLQEQRIETFREIVSCQCQRCGPLGKHFQLSDGATLISRTYTVSRQGAPIMLITESFPA
jgi:chorismate-pyruvate lyase